MNPMRVVILGFVLVYADLSVSGVDLLFDPAGWAFILLGLQQLLPRFPALVVPRNAAVVGLVFALAMMVISFGSFSDFLLENALQVLIFFTVCTALRRIVTDPDYQQLYGVARWVDLGLTVGALLALSAGLGLLATLPLLVDLGVVAFTLHRTWGLTGSEGQLTR